MNDVFVNDFNNQALNQDGDDSAISKMKNYNPSNLIFQHLSIKETVKKKKLIE